MIWLTQVNVRTRRQEEQAKEAERLEPKGTQPVRGCNGAPAGIRVLPVYRTNLSHPLNRLKRGTWKPRIFAPGTLGQVKPQGTLLEVRE